MNPIIKSTKDYSQFKFKKGNRLISKTPVLRIARSIEKHNMLSSNPIIVNSKKEVVDGQHRLKAAEKLGVEIYYITIDTDSITDVHLLNANMKVWSSRDFIQSYIELGKEDYKVFADFLERWDIPFSAALVLLGNENGERGRGIHQLFKEGEFTIKSLEFAETIAEIAQRLLTNAHDSVKSSNRFYDAVIKVYKINPTYIETIYFNSLGKEKIWRAETTREYMRQFEDYLNRNRLGREIRLY